MCQITRWSRGRVSSFSFQVVVAVCLRNWLRLTDASYIVSRGQCYITSSPLTCWSVRATERNAQDLWSAKGAAALAADEFVVAQQQRAGSDARPGATSEGKERVKYRRQARSQPFWTAKAKRRAFESSDRPTDATDDERQLQRCVAGQLVVDGGGEAAIPTRRAEHALAVGVAAARHGEASKAARVCERSGAWRPDWRAQHPAGRRPTSSRSQHHTQQCRSVDGGLYQDVVRALEDRAQAATARAQGAAARCPISFETFSSSSVKCSHAKGRPTTRTDSREGKSSHRSWWWCSTAATATSCQTNIRALARRGATE